MKEKLLKIQEKVGAIKKDADNPYFKSKYFDINSLLAQVKPILNEEGVVLLQPLSSVDGKPAIKTILIDTSSDERIEDVCPITDLPDPQKMGSAITYFRRYSLQSLLALEAEDDDANFASGKVVKEKKLKETNAPTEPPF